MTLDDYRARYAQYREDPDLQAAHRQHPFIVVWDDHEIANNAWSGGAGEPQRGEGDWEARKAAARRAWREWMPVREASTATSRMYRQFALGDLGDLLMLDTRLEGRDGQVRRERRCRARARRRARLLGSAQEEWLYREPARFACRRQAVADPRPAGDVRAAGRTPAPPAAGAGFLGRLPRRPRARVRDGGGGRGQAPARPDRRRAQRLGATISPRDPFDQARYDPATGRGAMGTEIDRRPR